MSLFAKLVVKAEQRELGAGNGKLSPLSVSTSDYEDRFWAYVRAWLAVWAGYVALIVLAQSNVGKTPIVPMEWWLVGGTLFAICAVAAEAKTLLAQAVRARLLIRERLAAEQAAEEAAERRRKAEVAAETNRLNAVAKFEREKKIMAVAEFRLQLLDLMEKGLKDLLATWRYRAEWVPQRVDEEHLYEIVRQRLSQASREVPEFGILRRSTDMTVLMILGDRTCLPQEPSDAVLAQRRIPSVGALLG